MDLDVNRKKNILQGQGLMKTIPCKIAQNTLFLYEMINSSEKKEQFFLVQISSKKKSNDKNKNRISCA